MHPKETCDLWLDSVKAKLLISAQLKEAERGGRGVEEGRRRITSGSRLLYPESGLSDFFAGKRFETGKAKLPKVMASRLGKGLGSNIYIRI